MKEIEFSEEQLENLDAIAQQLFYSGAEPGDPGYQRVLHRPEINWLRIALNVLLPIVVAVALGIAAGRVLPGNVAALVAAGILGIYMLLRAKAILICLVRIYQRYAPESLRDKCRFEPSCSEYMILSLEKYGLCKGLHKGVCRLKRCNIHHGGYDLP